MSVLHVLQHCPREGPERIGSVARSLGLGVVVHELDAGEPVPEELAPADLLPTIRYRCFGKIQIPVDG